MDEYVLKVMQLAVNLLRLGRRHRRHEICIEFVAHESKHIGDDQ